MEKSKKEQWEDRASIIWVPQCEKQAIKATFCPLDNPNEIPEKSTRSPNDLPIFSTVMMFIGQT